MRGVRCAISALSVPTRGDAPPRAAGSHNGVNSRGHGCGLLTRASIHPQMGLAGGTFWRAR